jgi:hypothetical protein
MGNTRLQAPSHRYGPDDRPMLVKASENVWMIGGHASKRRNGEELLATYYKAKLAKPYRRALSNSNRLTILLLPGVYDLGNLTLTVDLDYIDLVGLSPNTGSMVFANPLNLGDTIITSNSAIATITHSSQNGDNRCQNLCLANSNAAGVAFNLLTTGIPTIWRNLLLTNTTSQGNHAISWSSQWVGYYEDCRCWNDASWYGGLCSGTFIRCKAAGYAFAGGSTASGTFIDCEADGVSFGQNVASGIFIRCRYVAISGVSGALFGASGTASGMFIDCISSGNDGAFGGSLASGTFINCHTGPGATPAGSGFGPYTGTFSGSAEGCVGGSYSFASNGTFSGKARWCRISNTVNPFAPTTFTGTILYCDFPGWLNRPALSNQTASLALIPSDNDKLFTNRGAGGQIIYTLPDPSQEGMRFRFFVVAAQNLRVLAPSGVTIRVAGNVSAAAGHIDNATIGGYIELVALSSTEWYAAGQQGTWPVT